MTASYQEWLCYTNSNKAAYYIAATVMLYHQYTSEMMANTLISDPRPRIYNVQSPVTTDLLAIHHELYLYQLPG